MLPDLEVKQKSGGGLLYFLKNDFKIVKIEKHVLYDCSYMKVWSLFSKQR